MNIFQFVKRKVKWNGYKGLSLDKTLKRAYEEGSGNVAVINLMLTSILRKAGLRANPVLVSTRSNGIPFFPTRNGFNYLITAVSIGNETILLDASEFYSFPNLLPKRALNWRGRLIMKDGSSSWINLTSGASSKEQVAIMLQKILKFSEMPKYLDATDGLAVALCHHYSKGIGEHNKTKSNDWGSFIKNNPKRKI